MSFEEMCTADNEIVLLLPHTERLFLWAIRVWSAYHDDVRAIWRTLDQTFTEARITGALQPFDVMMGTIFIGLHRWPDIRCARCPRLGQDEVRLIDALRMLQQDDHEGAITLLRMLAAPAAARKACAAAAQVLTEMNRSGLRFSITPSQTEPPFSRREDSTHLMLKEGSLKTWH